jgi:cytochrome P450
MRLHPVGAAGSIRVTSKDLSADPYIIPKGSVVLVPTYAIQRDSKVFSRPGEFVPDWWSSPTPEMDSAWMAFALGRRNCKGQFLANMEMQVILSRLFSEYEWDVVHEGHSEYSVTLKTVGTILRAKRVAMCDKD